MNMQLLSVLVLLAFWVEPAKADPEVIERVDQTDSGWAYIQEFSAAEVRRICNEYEGKYIGFYDNVYLVEGCRRRRVDWNALSLREQSSRQVVKVDNSVIAALPGGKDYAFGSENRGCQDLENRYVTMSYTDIYLIESCSLRLFPDWVSFDNHRKSRPQSERKIHALAPTEIRNFRRGEPMPSTMDDEFSSILSGEAGVDVIPIDVACRGLNGKDVFYYSRIYRIENCRKREYNSNLLLMERRGNIHPIELTAEQWLSLPDGVPMHEEANSKNQ